MEKSICISFKTNEKQKETESCSLIKKMRQERSSCRNLSVSSAGAQLSEVPDPPAPVYRSLTGRMSATSDGQRDASSSSHQKQRNRQRARTCVSINITGCQSTSNNAVIRDDKRLQESAVNLLCFSAGAAGSLPARPAGGRACTCVCVHVEGGATTCKHVKTPRGLHSKPGSASHQ